MSDLTMNPGLRFEILQNKSDNNPPLRHCDFVFPGGTIGRGSDNDLVLPDAQQEIANLQVIIYIANSGLYQISNRGEKVIHLNGEAIERGKQRPVSSGDKLNICGYLLQTRELATATESAQPTKVGAHSSEDAGIPGAVWEALDTEYEPLQSVSSLMLDPLHPLLHRRDTPAAPWPYESQALTDKQFDLSPLFAVGDRPLHIMADTTPTVLYAKDSSTALGHPVLSSFASPGSAADRELLQTPWDPPSASLSSLLGGALPLTALPDEHAITQRVAAPDPVHREVKDKVSPPPLGNPQQRNEPLIEPLIDLLRTPAPQDLAPQTAALGLQHAPKNLGTAPAHAATRALAGAPAEQAPAPLAESLSSAEAQAFLDGLGLDPRSTAPMDREQLRRAGRLLKLLSHGMVKLLAAYGIAPSATENAATPGAAPLHNPLAVLPCGSSLLVQLLQQPLPNFTPPEAAINQAFAQLHAHQSGTVAGQQELIAALLLQLSPQQLEREAAQSGINASWRRHKKSIFWDYFVQQHQKISDKVGMDCDRLFETRYRQAYADAVQSTAAAAPTA